MAAFPNIEPTGRSYGLGAHPVAVAAFSSSDEVRFLMGATSTGVPLALEFRALNTADATAIRDHYLAQREHLAFTIPADLWRTHASQTDVCRPPTSGATPARPRSRRAPGGWWM